MAGTGNEGPLRLLTAEAPLVGRLAPYPCGVSEDPIHELTRNDAAKVAELALLHLSDADLDRFAGQLTAVLDRARDLEAIDIDGVPPTAHPYPLVNIFRPDEVERIDSVRDEALAAAPAVEDHLYRVPPALGEEP